VLALLAAFSVAFFSLVSLERKASQNYIDSVKARSVAKAGIERAKVELQSLAGKRAYSWIYPVGGAASPLAAPASTVSSTATDDSGPDAWGYAWTFPDGTPPTGSQPLFTDGEMPTLANTATPSFAITTDPRKPTAYPSRHFVYSGLMGATYANGADAYRLKIIDCAAQVNLNHPDKVSLRRMLTNLIKARFSAPQVLTPSLTLPVVSDNDALLMAQHVIDSRPPTGYGNKNDIFAVLPVIDDPLPSQTTQPPKGLWLHAWLQLRDDLTCHSWIDTKVVRPPALNNSSELASSDPLAQPIVRGFQAAARPPVNLNTASRSVLTALFADLKALQGGTTAVTIAFSDAKSIADAIVTYRNGSGSGTSSVKPRVFRSWEEFATFADSLKSSSLTQAQCDLIKAMMNPNSDILKCGGEINLGGGNGNGLRLVDKADIVRATTEGCFDAMGIYEVTSLGQLFDGDLNVIAEQSIMEVVKIYDIFRLTTQTDFEQNRVFGYPGNFLPLVKTDPLFDPASQKDPNGSPIDWKGLDTTISSAFFGPNYASFTAAQAFWGFPGILTYPQYSLVRKPDDGTHNGSEWVPDASNYEMASWDGYLVLSNLEGFATLTNDFAADFARGTTMAVKCRGWWEPKDQDHKTGQPLLDPSTGKQIPPSHPIVTRDGTGKILTSEADTLCSPLGGETYSPRLAPLNTNTTPPTPTAGALAQQKPAPRSLIDDTFDPGMSSLSNALEMFRDGSSLTNGGVWISPDRTVEGGTSPRLLVYDGRNLDTTPQGFSMRFWVQPQVDPSLHQTEVLVSWAGSQKQKDESDQTAGNSRDVGFRVYKLWNGSQTLIRLEPSFGSTPGAGNPTELKDAKHAVMQGGQPVDWWSSDWRDPKNTVGNSGTIDIDVTSTWTAHSWHWITIDCGGLSPQGSSGNKTLMSIRMSVDGKPNQTYQGASDTQTLYFYGHGPQSPDARNPGDGAIFHGHWDNFFSDTPSIDPLAGTVPNRTGVRVWWSPSKWFFGHYYCCEDPDVTGGQARGLKHHTLKFSNAIAYDGSSYSPTGSQTQTDDADPQESHTWPGAPFTSNDFDQQVTLIFTPISNQNPNNVTPPPNASMSPDGNSGKWKHKFTPPEEGPDQVPGGQEWQIDVQLDWDAPTQGSATNNCPECHNAQSDKNNLACNEDSYNNSSLDGGTFTQGYQYEYDRNCPQASTEAAQDPSNPYVHCWVIAPDSHGTLSVPSPFSWDIDKQHYCDDCHGCPSCAVRAPVFFGGEPSGTQNFQTTGGTLTTVPAAGNASTCANAIFDNIIIANGSPLKRTDMPESQYASSGAEDRFFESDIRDFLTNTKGTFYKAHQNTGNGNFGARYDRVLSELFGTTFRIGTLSWTQYTANVNGNPLLPFEVALFRVPVPQKDWSQSGPSYTSALRQDQYYYLKTNPWTGVIDGTAHNVLLDVDPQSATSTSPPSSRAYDANPAGGAYYQDGGIGIRFGDGVYISGNEIPAGTTKTDLSVLPVPEMLVLSVAVNVPQNLPGGRSLSPILDDVTLTIVLDSPSVLYSEEGVEE
jgi:hypothetical protein